MRLPGKYWIYLVSGILSWLVFTAVLFYQSISHVRIVGLQVDLAFAAFVTFNLLFIDEMVKRNEKWDVNEMLWKLFVIGISGLIVIVTLDHFLLPLFAKRQVGRIYAPIVAGAKVYAYLFFNASALFIFRKFIFYNKTKTKVFLWRIFLILLILGGFMAFEGGSSVLLGLKPNAQTPVFWVYLRLIIIPSFFIISLVLSAYVNWAAYLSLALKLRALIFMVTAAALMVAYFPYFPFSDFGVDRSGFFLNLIWSRTMILGMIFVFPLIYAGVSSLIVFFNLFTSSVFEQRSSEIASLQRITHSIQANFSVDETLRTLLDSALLSSNSPAGWIARAERDGSQWKFISAHKQNLSPEEIQSLDPGNFAAEECLSTGTLVYVRSFGKHKILSRVRTKYRSMLVVPVITRQHPVAVLYLLNELSQPYEEETLQSVSGLAEQASVAIENSELMRNSINLERYREQLKIARQMQERILPKTLPSSCGVEFFAIHETAEEIGGDYFDVYQTRKGNFRVALGDVSGKGTEAAFFMAETKGMFQALVGMDLDPAQFVKRLNAALRNCLRRGSFMTLSYLDISPDEKRFQIMRAGHCPALHFCKRQGKVTYLESGTLGLGILPDEEFGRIMVAPETHSWEEGDFLVLFTDGIVEARNSQREEFGYERLRILAENLSEENPAGIGNGILKKVMEFSGDHIEDDYVILVIRFQGNPSQKTS